MEICWSSLSDNGMGQFDNGMSKFDNGMSQFDNGISKSDNGMSQLQKNSITEGGGEGRGEGFVRLVHKNFHTQTDKHIFLIRSLYRFTVKSARFQHI
jgi:hypothetical protein